MFQEWTRVRTILSLYCGVHSTWLRGHDHHCIGAEACQVGDDPSVQVHVGLHHTDIGLLAAPRVGSDHHHLRAGGGRQLWHKKNPNSRVCTTVTLLSNSWRTGSLSNNAARLALNLTVSHTGGTLPLPGESVRTSGYLHVGQVENFQICGATFGRTLRDVDKNQRVNSTLEKTRGKKIINKK